MNDGNIKNIKIGDAVYVAKLIGRTLTRKITKYTVVDLGESGDDRAITLQDYAKSHKFTMPLKHLINWDYDTDLERLKKSVINANIAEKGQEIYARKQKLKLLEQELAKWRAFDPEQVKIEG